MLPVDFCSQCTHAFNTNRSSSYHSLKELDSLSYDLGVDNGVFYGVKAMDYLHLGQLNCRIHFLSIYRIEGTIPTNREINFGALGIDRKSFKVGMIDQMRIKNYISKKVIGIEFAGNREGKVIFGGYDALHIQEVKYFSALYSESSWKIQSEALKYGSNIVISPIEVIIAPHIHTLILGQEQGKQLLKRLAISGKECRFDEAGYFLRCHVPSNDYSQFEPLNLYLSSEEIIRVLPEEYIEFTAEAFGYKAKFQVQAAPEGYPAMTLGTLFLKKRYIVLDGDELKVGFALFKTEEEETEIWLSIIIISAVIFIILIIAGIILAKKLMRKKSRKFITRRKQYKFYLEKVYKIFGNLLLLFNSETSRLNANDI